MTTENTETVQVEQSATLESAEVKQPEVNTPDATAAEGEVDKQKQAEPAKTFTQAEVDAIVQKRLLKTERRIHREIEQRLRDQVVATPPNRDAFVSDEEYSQAEIDHRAELKARDLLQQRERQKEAERQQETFLERAEKVHERYPDFETVVKDPTLPINDAMADYIQDSEHGPDVAYFLGKNRGKALEISQMKPMAAAKELVRIEAELASKPKVSLSKAPEPITPVSTRGKASSSSMPSDADPIDVWMRKEQERLRKRR
jgi:hypothetical protein